jgi:hypothetical protein
MKKFLSTFALMCLLTDRLQAGVVLGTTDPPGSPLTMSSGTTSGLMYVNVVSDNPLNDVMAAWQLQVEIISEGGTGTLTFQDPPTGMAPTPLSYVFGGDGLGITATNTGTVLSANDFDTNLSGTPVPGSPGVNLLQMDFLASAGASGLFGIYADEGSANTQWTDRNANQQFFTNVPNGTGAVLIGEVQVTAGGNQAVPEPSSLTLLWLGGTTLCLWNWRRKRKNGGERSAIGEDDSSRQQLFNFVD